MSGARASGWLLALMLAPPLTVAAQKKPARTSKTAAPAAPVPVAPATVVTPELIKELEGPDEGHAIDAARKLGEAGDPASVAALVDALAHGAPPRVAAAMVRALG